MVTAVDDTTFVTGSVPTLGAASVPTLGATSVRARSPRATATLARRKLWERRFRVRLALTDIAVILFSVGCGAALQLFLIAQRGVERDALVTVGLPLLTACTWVLLLALFNTRSWSVVGSGSAEYTRVAHATGLAFGALAILFVLFQWEGIRAQLMVALPLGIVLLIAERRAWRHWLARRQLEGDFVSLTVVAGEREEVEYVIRRLDASRDHSHLVVAATLTDSSDTELRIGNRSVPVVGRVEGLAQVARLASADTVIVASRPDDDPEFLKRLSWQLEGTASELILSSRLTDVAGPRVTLRPVDGLPLIQVKLPTFDGGQHVLKRAVDIVVSSLALLMIAPIGAVIAALIALDSRGGVFFTQRRVGRDGMEFPILKFRTMRSDAEESLAALRADNEGAGLLFKMKNDPRVTRVGRILRKYSLDELPQFVNVLLGHMSVVGPRPPLPSEVMAYDGRVVRRLYIKPGITGLWQVSGRSDLSWDESVRLDLRYVENWSIMTDVMIMWQTAKVMIDPKGAY